MSAKRVILELKKLTPKEKDFIIEFLLKRTGDKNVDERRFEFDISLSKYKNENRLRRLFEMLYPLNDEEIGKIAKAVGK